MWYFALALIMATTNSQASLRQRQRDSNMSLSDSSKVDAVSTVKHLNATDKKNRSEEVVWGKTPNGEGKLNYAGKLSIVPPIPNSLPCAHNARRLNNSVPPWTSEEPPRFVEPRLAWFPNCIIFRFTEEISADFLLFLSCVLASRI